MCYEKPFEKPLARYHLSLLVKQQALNPVEVTARVRVRVRVRDRDRDRDRNRVRVRDRESNIPARFKITERGFVLQVGLRIKINYPERKCLQCELLATHAALYAQTKESSPP